MKLLSEAPGSGRSVPAAIRRARCTPKRWNSPGGSGTTCRDCGRSCGPSSAARRRRRWASSSPSATRQGEMSVMYGRGTAHSELERSRPRRGAWVGDRAPQRHLADLLDAREQDQRVRSVEIRAARRVAIAQETRRDRPVFGLTAACAGRTGPPRSGHGSPRRCSPLRRALRRR